MESVLARLSSFGNFLDSTLVSAARLADAGFFMRNNHIICFICGVQIDEWTAQDDPVLKHRDRSPNCSFILQKLEKLHGSGAICAPNTNFGTTIGQKQPEQVVTTIGATSNIQTQPSKAGSQSATILQLPQQPNKIVPPPYEQLYPETRQSAELPTVNQQRPAPKLPDTGTEIRTRPKTAYSLRRESERLETFRRIDWSNLTTSRIAPESIAQAGMYYIGPGDKVQCAFCKGKLYNWSPSDNPYEEHSKHFKSCIFVMNPYEAGNVRTEDEVAPDTSLSSSVNDPEADLTPEQYMLRYVKEKPAYPQFGTIGKRLTSYAEGGYQNQVQHANALSEAGFIYMGPGDNVRCFFCAGGLRSWAPTDLPWEEHARWFPSCFYIRACKGERFIQLVHEKFAVNGAAIASQIQQGDFKKHTVDGHELRTVSTTALPVDEWLKTELPRSFLEMGYSKALLRNVYENRLEEYSEDFPNPDSLLDALMDFERTADDEDDEEAEGDNASQNPGAASAPQPGAGTANGQDTSTTSKKRRRKKNKKQKDKPKPEAEMEKSSEEKAEDPNNLTDEYKAKMLERENEALREQRICKICLDKEVNVVFLRCGHLVSCIDCAGNLKLCPICREVIRGTVRTFLS